MRKQNPTPDLDEKRKAIGARVRQLREQADMTLDDLAAIAGIGVPGHRSGPTVGAWEREGGATLDTVLKVAETLASKLGRSRVEVLSYIAWG